MIMILILIFQILSSHRLWCEGAPHYFWRQQETVKTTLKERCSLHMIKSAFTTFPSPNSKMWLQLFHWVYIDWIKLWFQIRNKIIK